MYLGGLVALILRKSGYMPVIYKKLNVITLKWILRR